MNKYYVVAIKWSDKAHMQVKYIAGEFDEYFLAKLFKKAYDEHYSANAEIVEGKDILTYNGRI